MLVLMKRLSVLTAFFLFLSSALAAQQRGDYDVIVTRDGSRTEAIVLEINTSEIVYQTRPDGPYYVLDLDEASEVIFSGGFRQDLTSDAVVPFDRRLDSFPGVMSSRGARLCLGGQPLSDSMVRSVIPSYEYWSGYREPLRKWKAGRALTYGGLGCIAAAGAVCAWDVMRCRGSEVNVSEWTTIFAARLGAVGVLSAGSGIVLKRIGKTRLDELAARYNAAHGKYPQPREAAAKLSFGAGPSGLTLALQF